MNNFFFLPGFSMESIPESWLLLSDESFVLKDSRLSLCCDDSSLNAILQDSRLGWFDFLGPEIFKKIYEYIVYIQLCIYTYRRQGFLKIHYYYKDGLNVFLKKKSENIVFRLGSGSNKEKTTYLPNKVSCNGSGTLKLGFG